MEKISHNAPDNKMAGKISGNAIYCSNFVLLQSWTKENQANAVMYENIISMYYNGTVFYFIWYPPQ